MRLWALFIVLCALGMACSPTPKAAPRLERPVELKGRDTGRTETFHLDGGAYRVEWTAQSDTSYERTCAASLGDAETGVNTDQLFSAGVQGRANGDDRVYGVEPGTYYLSVVGCGAWTVILASI